MIETFSTFLPCGAYVTVEHLGEDILTITPENSHHLLTPADYLFLRNVLDDEE